jgi:hypothetical protein
MPSLSFTSFEAKRLGKGISLVLIFEAPVDPNNQSHDESTANQGQLYRTWAGSMLTSPQP